MASKTTFLEKKVTYNTVIEINDDSNDFIPYWNLAMKEHLNNNFITVGPEANKSGAKPLNSFHIKLVDKKEYYSPENGDGVQLNKLFIIDVYRVKKEKEFNDFVKIYKNKHSSVNFNVILYNIDEVKDDVHKNINKIYEKIKYKTGLADFSFIPYNNQNYGKFYSVIDNFFISLKSKITYEYNILLKEFSAKIENKKNIYTSDELTAFEYIKNKVLYLDLLIMGEFWEDIKKACIIDMFQTFDNLKKIYNYKHCTSFAELNINEIKQKTKNKVLSNVEYQLFLLYNYIRSCRYLKEYNNLANYLCNFAIKIDLYESSFKTIYHFHYWKINCVLNIANYLIAFKEVLTQKDFDNKNSIEQGIIFLYSAVSKYFKIYGKKILKIEIPSVRIFIFLKDCTDKGLNLKEELKKNISVDLGELEKDEIFQKFKSDIKLINDNDKSDNPKKNLYDIFINKKAFIEEYLLMLQLINKRNCDFTNCKTSIRKMFEIIPLLLSLNKFEEAKDYLNSLLQRNIFKSNKWNYILQYICIIFVMLLNCLEKNKETLYIMFKILDTNFSKLDDFLKLLGSEDVNLINDIISKYIESYSEIETDNKDDKINKTFSLDKAIDINLEKIKDNIIFINKSKTKKEQIRFKFTNNTGISVNVDKIQLIFEEFSSSNNNQKNNEEKKDNKEKKQIIYEINSDSNTFKTIIPFVKEQENVFDIIVDESNDLFQLNTIYKFKEIKFIIKNSLCGIYHIKEDMKISINPIDMKITTQIYPSYDTSDFSDEIKNVLYYNTLSKININLIDIPSPEELNNKSLKFIVEDINKRDDTTLIIQTHVLKENIIKHYPDVIIEDSSIEFPPGSLKDKEKLENLVIPFYVENINFYSNGLVSIKITVYILDKNDNDKIVYSYVSFYNINLIHLFNIKKKFRLLNNNLYLMQTTFSLNIEANNIKVYTHNSTNYSFYIDTTQAINLVLKLKNNKNDIIKKLRENFLDFSVDEINKETKEKKINKFRLCYPEKNIIEEIKELKEIPYHIVIDVEDGKYDVFKEINVNINIKKKNNKNIVLLTHICDNENWAIIGKSKLVEKWLNDDKENNNEKNIKIQLLPLIDGFLKLPEIEFLEYEIQGQSKDKIEKINLGKDDDNEDSKDDEMIIGKMTFEPIEYGTVIEGNAKILKITPATECSLKLNLT